MELDQFAAADLTGGGILGVGRVCTDRYITIERTGSRLNATKSSFVEAGTYVGGSVPRILATCRSLGHPTFLLSIAGMDSGDEWLSPQLADLVGEFWLASALTTPDSLVIHSPDGSLDQILSLREVEQISVADVQERGLPALRSASVARSGVFSPPRVVVVDGRHPKSLAVLRDEFPDSQFHLDPGSSAVVIPGDEYEALEQLADLVFLSHGQAIALAGSSDFSTFFSERARRCETAFVVTLGADGAFVAHAQRTFTVPAWPVEPKGSSIGAGDTMKGVAASHLASTSGTGRFVDDASLSDAIARGLTAASWRLASQETVPRHPSLAELRRFWMSTRVEDEARND